MWVSDWIQDALYESKLFFALKTNGDLMVGSIVVLLEAASRFLLSPTEQITPYLLLILHSNHSKQKIEC